jgi:hypothetical protein
MKLHGTPTVSSNKNNLELNFLTLLSVKYISIFASCLPIKEKHKNSGNIKFAFTFGLNEIVTFSSFSEGFEKIISDCILCRMGKLLQIERSEIKLVLIEIQII